MIKVVKLDDLNKELKNEYLFNKADYISYLVEVDQLSEKLIEVLNNVSNQDKISKIIIKIDYEELNQKIDLIEKLKDTFCKYYPSRVEISLYSNSLFEILRNSFVF